MNTIEDKEMFEDLIARVRVYKAKSDNKYEHRPYEIELISDKKEIFKNINHDNDRNNCSKAEFIFNQLTLNGVIEEEYDNCYGEYKNIKSVEAITLIDEDLHIDYHNLQYEQGYSERDGWSICGIDLTRVIMYKFILTNNTIIRFDFQGMIDNEKDTQAIYFQDIIDKNAELIRKHTKEKEIKKLIEQIQEEKDHIIEPSASSVYKNPKNNFDENSGLIPNGEFPYMVEFFSDCIEYDSSEYQGAFGVNSKYIKKAMKMITDVENRAKEIENKYADKGVKVTVNGMNDGCEYGMAIYVWIPYQ